MPAGVHVNRHQRLRFVNDDVAAALQMHLAREGVLQLLADVEPVENRLGVGVQLYFVGERREILETISRIRSWAF